MDDGTEINLLELKQNDVFGERALMKKEPRAANIKAIGQVLSLYTIDMPMIYLARVSPYSSISLSISLFICSGGVSLSGKQ
jgi:hypothetical protein